MARIKDEDYSSPNPRFNPAAKLDTSQFQQRLPYPQIEDSRTFSQDQAPVANRFDASDFLQRTIQEWVENGMPRIEAQEDNGAFDPIMSAILRRLLSLQEG